jgi:hypothetical protein
MKLKEEKPSEFSVILYSLAAVMRLESHREEKLLPKDASIDYYMLKKGQIKINPRKI